VHGRAGLFFTVYRGGYLTDREVVPRNIHTYATAEHAAKVRAFRVRQGAIRLLPEKKQTMLLVQRLDRVRTKRAFPGDGITAGAIGTVLEISAGDAMVLVRLDGPKGSLGGEMVYLQAADVELQPKDNLSSRLSAAASARASR
jgi:hypothetical protein